MKWLTQSTSKKVKAAKPGEVNYSLIDRFTFAHLIIGVTYYLIGFDLLWVLVFAIVWELIENPLKLHLTFIFPHATADTYGNAIFDTIAVVLGWCLVYILINVY